MPIKRLLEPERRKIAWLDSDVPKKARIAFGLRDYAVERCTAQQLSDSVYLAGLGAVVLSMSPANDFPALKLAIEAHAQLLLAYDCRVLVRYPRSEYRDASLVQLIGRLELANSNLLMSEQAGRFKSFQDPDGEPPQPNVRFYDFGVSWHMVANDVAYDPAGKAPDPNVAILPLDNFNLYEQLLLKRAFEGCTEVHLEPLEDGWSGGLVFRAHARLPAVNGAWTQPYFVKLGRRLNIMKEFANYQDKVDPYVPFHLGPHLVPERCCLTGREGILVGDYVEQSESLKLCARDDRAVMAISCLFDRTLRGWYRNCTPDDRILMTMPGARTPTAIPPAVAKVAKELGATLNLPRIGLHLSACTERPWLRGPIHGDLHARNVRVRATDAIVIDFNSHRDGLLLRDIARLEVSLLTDAFGGPPYEDPLDNEKFEGVVWLRAVAPLYQMNPTTNNPQQYEDPKSPAYWFHACARQIRLQARQFQLGERQYAAALALELLLKASRGGMPCHRLRLSAEVPRGTWQRPCLKPFFPCTLLRRRASASVIRLPLHLRGTVTARSAASLLLAQRGDAVLVERGYPRWIVIKCPEGCGDELPINLDREAGPAWRLYLSKHRGLTIYPSVWRDVGCGAHFIVWRGSILLLGTSDDSEEELYWEDITKGVLRDAVLSRLSAEKSIHSSRIAEELGEDPWDVLETCRQFVKTGLAMEGKGKQKEHFRRR